MLCAEQAGLVRCSHTNGGESLTTETGLLSYAQGCTAFLNPSAWRTVLIALRVVRCQASDIQLLMAFIWPLLMNRVQSFKPPFLWITKNFYSSKSCRNITYELAIVFLL